jgi:hypothetical protein
LVAKGPSSATTRSRRDGTGGSSASAASVDGGASSAWAAGAMDAQAREIETIPDRSRETDDRVFYVDFAGEAVRRDRGDPVFEGATQQTRTGMAL